jgi:hypothetical protein
LVSFLGLSPWTYGFADHPVAVIGVVAFGSVAVLVGTFDIYEGVHGDARPTGARRQEVSVTRPARSANADRASGRKRAA